jgi:hypothetical protein
LNTTLPAPLPANGHDHSDLHAVSDNGFAAGQFQYSGSSPAGGARDGFLLTPRLASVSFYTLSGALSSAYECVAKAISRDGVIQGGWSYKPGFGSLVKPVIWKDYLTIAEIPLLTGGDGDDSGEIHALNGDGSVVAGISWRAAQPSGPAEAFIWTAANGTRSVATVLAQRGFDVTGWTFSDVTSMSADATMMCGNGKHNGVAKGWVVAFLDLSPRAPRLTRQPLSLVLQPGVSATFQIEAIAEGSPSYNWQLNGVDLPDSPHYQGAFSPTLTVVDSVAADDGSYRCRVSNPYGQVMSQPASLSHVTVRPDFDGDGDVDQVDFGFLQSCMSGPTIPQTAPACAPARLDGDDDVDQNDLAILRACMTASGVLANLNCD